jgi:hypothetical protein
MRISSGNWLNVVYGNASEKIRFCLYGHARHSINTTAGKYMVRYDRLQKPLSESFAPDRLT